MIDEKHTLDEWANIYDIEILDPDGFDRSDRKLYERLFTREEFEKGLIYCTIQSKGAEK